MHLTKPSWLYYTTSCLHLLFDDNLNVCRSFVNFWFLPHLSQIIVLLFSAGSISCTSKIVCSNDAFQTKIICIIWSHIPVSQIYITLVAILFISLDKMWILKLANLAFWSFFGSCFVSYHQLSTAFYFQLYLNYILFPLFQFYSTFLCIYLQFCTIFIY